MTAFDPEPNERLSEAISRAVEANPVLALLPYDQLKAGALSLAAQLVKAEANPMRGIEMSLAYEHAADAIDDNCSTHPHEDALENGWYDLDSTVVDLTDEVAYLDSRRLLMRHPEHPQWVTICDEGDPLPEGGVAA